MITVAVSSRFPSVRAGLRAMLESGESLSVVVDGFEGAGEVDVVVLDFDEESFDETLRQAAKHESALVLLGAGTEIVGCLNEVHIRGWALLSRDASSEEIAAAVQAAAQGLVVLEPAALRQLGSPVFAHREAAQPVTQRERQILQLIAAGLANKEIGKQLQISVHTVKFHVAAILEKLGVASRAEAVSVGIRNGVVHL